MLNTTPKIKMNYQEKIQTYLRAKQAYYFGTPMMSDAQFDKLEEDIRKENPEEAVLKMVGAPVPKSTPHEKAKHLIHMGSQEKVDLWEELQNWERLRANNLNARFHASFKADGGSLAIYYQGGQLNLAVTRGEEGIEGENISAQASLFQGIPIQLAKPLDVGVRFEAVVMLSDWERADPEMSSNPRNVANGILGRLDVEKADCLTPLAFDLNPIAGDSNEEIPEFQTESEKAKYIESLGFQVVTYKGNLTLKEVKEFYEETLKKREANELPHWIDGIIVRYEDIELQKELGQSDNRPKGQIAWKFPREEVPSKLLSVDLQVGHTGAITPVAYIDPVRIGGTTVSKASLANWDNIKTLGAFIGADIIVTKAGDIIPQIIEVKNKIIDSPDFKKIEIPCSCPVCSSALEKRKNVDGSESVVIFCPNPDCEAKVAGKLDRYCKSRNILGIGDSVIAALAKSHIVRSVADLYRLKPEQVENLVINEEKGVRLGKKRAEAICSEILKKGSEMTLPQFLGAFGTRALGVRRATLMLKANDELNLLDRWFDGSLLKEVFAAHSGVPKMGKIIYEDLKENEERIREVLQFVKLTEPEPEQTIAADGKIFCITGSLPSGRKKKEFAPLLEAVGCQLVDDLKADVNVLVMADPNGPESSKTKKAKKLGIELMSEEDLVKFIEERKTTDKGTETKEPTSADKPNQEPTSTSKKLEQSSLF